MQSGKAAESLQSGRHVVQRMISSGAIDAARHADDFAAEMSFIGAGSSTLFFVFGGHAQRVFAEYLADRFPNIVNCEHFACYRKTEDWLRDLWQVIDSHAGLRTYRITQLYQHISRTPPFRPHRLKVPP